DKRLGLYVRCVRSATPEIPTKFRLHAYSIFGNQQNDDHWMGWTTGNPWANILTDANARNSNIMNIKKVVADDVADIVYLQVENYPGSEPHYLTVDPSDGNKIKIVKGKSLWAKFRIKPSLQTETPDSDYVSFEAVEKPNFYLRHEGFKMYLHEATRQNLANKVYIEDASWLFQKLP
ncbi:MAG: AbfB domain-containing protein, partial [Bacteroidota bacterium]